MFFRRRVNHVVSENGARATSPVLPTIDRQEITLGVNVETGEPFRFPLRLLGHMATRGMSGSGKSSMTFCSLIAQLIPFAIVIIDLGGDLNLFHCARMLAKNAGKVFRFLTLDPDLETYHFPLFQSRAGSRIHVPEISQRLLVGNHLYFGAAQHGPTYFAAQSLAAILSVAKGVFAKNPHPTIAEVDQYLHRPSNVSAFKDAASIRMNMRLLLEYPQLEPSSDPERNMLFERGIQNSELLYFYLPTLDDPMVAPIVGGMALASLIHIASQRGKAGEPKVPVFCLIDECSEIVGRSLSTLLVQGRKWGLKFNLAYQSTSQLENKDTNLVHSLFEGTAVKQYFTCVGDSDTEVLQSVSRDKIQSLGGSSVQGLSTSVSFRDTIVRTLERNRVLDVSATFGQSFVLLNSGTGHLEPFVVQQQHEFPDWSDEPMPRRKAEPAADDGAAVNVNRTQAAPRMDAAAKARDQRIAAAIAKMAALERWELEA